MSTPSRRRRGDLAAIIDIDGVLVRGGTAIPGALAALQRLDQAGVPFCFVTNSGVPPAEKIVHLRHLLADGVHGVEAPHFLHDPLRVVTATTPFEHHPAVKDSEARLLIVSNPPTRACAHDLATSFGVAPADLSRRVVIPSDLARMYPQLFPSSDRSNRDPEAAGQLTLEEDPVRAVLVCNQPPDWGEGLQYICDVVRGGGFVAAEGDEPIGIVRRPVPVLGGNPDLDYAAEHHKPRLTLGAFLHCLESLYSRTVSADPAALPLEIEHNGKPFRGVYAMAFERLRAQMDGDSEWKPVKIFCIGDNPVADIRGARTAHKELGLPTFAILTRSGCFVPTPTEPNSLSDPADAVVDTISGAVDVILGDEGVYM